ncbi:MAG TPA: hypothetical protein VF874_02240 [Mycobacterium sp.]
MDDLCDDTPEGAPSWLSRPKADTTQSSGAWPGRGTLDTTDRGKYKVLRRQFLEQAMARGDLCLARLCP